MFINIRELVVGRDVVFYLSPQVIHRVQLRALFRKPYQLNVEGCGQSLTARRRMTARLVQQQPDGPTRIRPAQQPQKILKALLPHVPLPQHDAMAGADIDGSKKHPFIVASSNGYDSLLAPQRPCSSEVWKQPQDRLIFKEQDSAGRQML
jgi:hypothetical protein